MASHAGAARFAYNAGLAHVKEALDNGESPEWSHYSLLRWWNKNKDTLAVNGDTGVVWWGQNSKEAYSMGLRAWLRVSRIGLSPAKASVRARGLVSLGSSRRVLLCGSRIPLGSPRQRHVTLTG